MLISSTVTSGHDCWAAAKAAKSTVDTSAVLELRSGSHLVQITKGARERAFHCDGSFKMDNHTHSLSKNSQLQATVLSTAAAFVIHIM